MDLAGARPEAVLGQLEARLGSGCVDFGAQGTALAESIAMCDEQALEHYMEQGSLQEDEVRQLVARRKLFPCFFGSALKLSGVDALLDSLERFAPVPQYPEDFAARVYKIARDPQGARLTYMKITGGSLKVRSTVSGGPGEDSWAEKVTEIRIYSGDRFRTVDQAPAGSVCAVTGLSHTFPGQGLGAQPEALAPALEPVLTYQVSLPEGCDTHTALEKLRLLEEEDPMLRVVHEPRLGEIHVQLMGEVQLEILRQVMLSRFGLAVDFSAGSIVYRETISAPVVGIGHYEPLRHYAEVHLLLEPLPPGSGLRFESRCSLDVLDINFQRLVLTHLRERTHRGVLTGAPITDMAISLLVGRNHLKHTAGGDFRQATYRAVRHGLMQAQSVLLEPWYDFRLEIPQEQVGRAMADIQRMQGESAPPESAGDMAVLLGSAPVGQMRDYTVTVAAYSKGRGRLSVSPKGYRPCRDQAAVVEQLAYRPEADLDHTPDSVFCTHGGGYTVGWREVKAHAHLDSGYKPPAPEPPPQPATRTFKSQVYTGGAQQDKELRAIYERTYGPEKERSFIPVKELPPDFREAAALAPQGVAAEYLLVDGYNIIFAWDALKGVAAADVAAARQMLMDLLCNYQGVRQCVVILVFDAYKVPGGTGVVERYNNIYVVYTKEAETADGYIEKVTFELGRRYRVRVATSDSAEQLIILGHGAQRVSAPVFYEEVCRADRQIADILQAQALKNRPVKLRDIMEKPGQ